MHPKRKLRLTRQTVANLTGEQLDRIGGGAFPTLTTIIGDSPPRPPRTGSIAPCCASNDGPCPTE
jgi:hypothetical protein